MPRKSAAALATVIDVTKMSRVRAPKDIPAAHQARINTLIASKPAEYFSAADLPLLVLLARHMERADRLDEEVQKLAPEDLEGLKWLAPLAERETKTIVALLRSLRLTVQSRYRADSSIAHSKPPTPRPWNFEQQDTAEEADK